MLRRKQDENTHQVWAFTCRQWFNVNFETITFFITPRLWTTLILRNIKKEMAKMSH